MQQDLTVCQTLAPEDVSAGDYITQMQVVYEYPSFFWSCDVALRSPEQPVRYSCTPYGSGIPARVRSVCLPFVFVELADGDSGTWDLRSCRIARMPNVHAQAVWKKLKPIRKRKKRKMQRKKK